MHKKTSRLARGKLPGTPEGNRTPIYSSGGCRLIHWATGAHYAEKKHGSGTARPDFLILRKFSSLSTTHSICSSTTSGDNGSADHNSTGDQARHRLALVPQSPGPDVR